MSDSYHSLQSPETYAEVDPAAAIVLAAERCTFTALDQGDDAYIYKDFGAGYFDGDFEVQFELFISALAGCGAGVEITTVFTMINFVGSIQDTIVATNPAIFLMLDGINAPADSFTLQLGEMFGAAYQWGTTIAFDAAYLSTVIYATVKRESARFSVEYYSDAARTTLIDEDAITLRDVVAYRYLYCLQGREVGAGGTATGYVENYDIVHDRPYEVSKENCYEINMVDALGRLTLGENSVEFTDLDTDETAYAFIDLGSIPGDFQFDFKPSFSLTNLPTGWSFFGVGFWDGIGDFSTLKTGGGNGLLIHFENIRDNYTFRTFIREIDAGVVSDSGFRDWSPGSDNGFGAEPYIRLWRRDQNAHVRYYDDPNYVSPNLTNDLALTDIREYRYLYVVQSNGGALAGRNVWGSINDVRIRPARYAVTSGFDYQSPKGEMGGNTGSLETTSPGWRSLNNKRSYRGTHSYKAWSKIGGASGRVRAYVDNDFNRAATQGILTTLYQRIYVYIPSPWVDYVNPLVMYSSPRTEYLMWLILDPTYIDVRRYYPADVTYRIDGFTPEADKWMEFVMAMSVHASEGWYRLWYADADKRWKRELIFEQTGLDTSGATDPGNQPKMGIVHFEAAAGDEYCYVDVAENDESYIWPKPFPKYPTRLQSSE